VVRSRAAHAQEVQQPTKEGLAVVHTRLAQNNAEQYLFPFNSSHVLPPDGAPDCPPARVR
jgi:hypothetical protein